MRKNIIMLFVLLALPVMLINAQPPKGNDPNRNAKQFEEMVAAVGLTPDQVEKAKGFHKAFMDTMKAKREIHKGDREAMRDMMKEESSKYEANMKSIMTEEQALKFEEFIKKMRSENKEPGKKRGEGAH